MEKIGYSLVELKSNNEVKFWDTYPNAVEIYNDETNMNDVLYGVSIGYEHKGYKFCERYVIDNLPSEFHKLEGYTYDLSNNNLILTKTYTVDNIDNIKIKIKNKINIKCNNKINEGISFANTIFQTTAEARENIAGVSQLATLAIISGKGVVNNLYWSDEIDENNNPRPFTFIDLYNNYIEMDALTVINFGKYVAFMKKTFIYFARNLKDQINNCNTYEEIIKINIDENWPNFVTWPEATEEDINNLLNI